MKVVNICLAGSYNDGWGYQDNLLTKYQKLNGNDVTIITSRFVNEKNSEKYLTVPSGIYVNELGIKIKRLDFVKFTWISKIFRKYRGLYGSLSEENPNLIFIHCCQFVDIISVCKYVKNHPNVRVKVDNHADYTNSAKSIPAKILHYTLWRYCARKIDRYAEKFYGVMPSRCDFLMKYYGINKSKIDLLVMGADDELIENTSKNLNELSKKVNPSNNFLIITGGKIDMHKKETIDLMKAINQMKDVKLLIFGSIVEELISEFNANLSEKVTYLGWINQQETYNYLAASDLAVFPGRHSVLWEQAVGIGLPSIFKKWKGTTHVDLGGNCIIMDNCSEENLKKEIENLRDDNEKYQAMKKNAVEKKKYFSYKEIARMSVE